MKAQEERQKGSIHDLSAVSSAHSSLKGSHTKLPSIQILKEDARIQAEVEQRIQGYSDTSHNDHAVRPTTHKSGRFRAGISRVKVTVSWPQDFYGVPAGSKQPLYDEMTNEQWVQGMLFCIMEETNAEIRSQMLSYFAILMQDAIELSLGTTRRTHAAVLQEMKKGKLFWVDSDQLEKCKNRHTQLMLTSVKSAHSTVNQARIVYNKGKCKQNNDHTNNGILYHNCFSYCLKEMSKRYDHPMTQCMHMCGSSGQPKPDIATNKVEKP